MATHDPAVRPHTAVKEHERSRTMMTDEYDHITQPQAPAHAPHEHGPVPSLEWVLQGDQLTVTPHLRTLAPTLTLNGQHFDITEVDRLEERLPPLFMVEVDDTPVGGVDFLPLPAERTLMRLYLCTDLGTACRLENGDQVATGFVEVWLGRLKQLGFMTLAAPAAPAAQEPQRRLGFATPARP